MATTGSFGAMVGFFSGACGGATAGSLTARYLVGHAGARITADACGYGVIGGGIVGLASGCAIGHISHDKLCEGKKQC